jgi:hypothetical protein
MGYLPNKQRFLPGHRLTGSILEVSRPSLFEPGPDTFPTILCAFSAEEAP